MGISVGIDIAKDLHWVTAVDDDGRVHLDRAVANTADDIAQCTRALLGLGGDLRVGIDVLGGIAGLLTAILLEADAKLLYVPGLTVNRARQGMAGGENKSDPKDARAIAEQVRTRQDLRPVTMPSEIDIDMRLLVGLRRDLVAAQTQRFCRLRDLISSIFPGLERSLDVTAKGPMHLLTRYVTPLELRSAGRSRLLRHLQKAKGVPAREALADRVLAAAQEQQTSVSGERMTSRLVKELAVEALSVRTRLGELDREISELLSRHAHGELIQSLPGMGPVLAAELIAEAGDFTRFRSAEALASVAGIAPVLRQSGRARFLRRPTGGNRHLKRIFYQSAFCSLQHPDSRAFYDRKRQQGKHHRQAVIALARRRINVLWAMLQTQSTFQPDFKNTA